MHVSSAAHARSTGSWVRGPAGAARATEIYTARPARVDVAATALVFETVAALSHADSLVGFLYALRFAAVSPLNTTFRQLNSAFWLAQESSVAS